MKNTLTEMMSTIPTNGNGQNVDGQILRAAIISELDAISLYEQLASVTTNEDVKKILLDVANEEKTHVGEFQALLLEIDPEQEKELDAGEKEEEEVEEENESMKEARNRLYGKTRTQGLNEMKSVFNKLIK